MDADSVAIRKFIQRVHGQELSGERWLIVWTRQNAATRAFNLAVQTAIDQIVDYTASRATAFDVYGGIGLQGRRPTNGGRGKEDGVVSLPGFWADVDVASPAHKKHDLPPTEQEALSLIDAVGLPPSIIVRSGHGLQPYWLFHEPFLIETVAARMALKSLSRRFQELIGQLAHTRGWTLDQTADLCRVLRIPGSFNRKTDDVRLVTAEYFDRAYRLDEIKELVNGVDDNPEPAQKEPQPELPPAKLLPILDGCGWMRHCQDDATSLVEPEWYRCLSIVARCEDAEHWAHELSRSHPKYSHRETQRKLKQASSGKVAPVTCAYVQSDLNGGRFCSECLFRDNVNSPIAIGRIEVSEAVPAFRATGNDPLPPELPPTEAAAIKIEKHTDLGNARRFVARYRGTILYCEAWSRWLVGFHAMGGG